VCSGPRSEGNGVWSLVLEEHDGIARASAEVPAPEERREQKQGRGDRDVGETTQDAPLAHGRAPFFSTVLRGTGR
jgi:hypothetical protein